MHTQRRPSHCRSSTPVTWDNRGVGMLQRMRPRAGVTAISYRKSSSSLLPQTVVRLLNLAWKNCQRNESPTSRPFNLLSVRWLQPGNPACHCRTKHLAAALRAMDATAHIEEQDYHSALSAMEAALIHAPQNTEYQLLYCMLKERAGKPSNEAK